MAPLSERFMDRVRGLIRAIMIKKVSITEKCIIDLLLDFIPLIKDNNKEPAKTGIRSAGDGVSDPRYPKSPKRIKINEFIVHIRYTFIKCNNFKINQLDF